MFTKPRYEFKYIARLDIIEVLRKRLKESMTPDPNATDGGYHVNSIVVVFALEINICVDFLGMSRIFETLVFVS